MGFGFWAAMEEQIKLLLVTVCLFIIPCFSPVLSETDPSDFAILRNFREGLKNSELLKWPLTGNDPCGPPAWPHVFCAGSRVSQIQVQGLGLNGPLPQNFNQLSKLKNLGLQRNNFTGSLPTFKGLMDLQYAYLGGNRFDSIPSDFFNGLTSLQVLSLEYNPLNQSSGWVLPSDLQESAQLTNLSLSGCNLVGTIPDFLGQLPSLTALKLSYNRLFGEIPASFKDSQLQILWLNNQDGNGLSGSINVVAAMLSITELWLHGNQFTGTIPAALADCYSLSKIKLNDNQFVGPIPQNLTTMQLQLLTVDNNKLSGPIPEFKTGNFTYSGNSFCQSVPGTPCAPEVSALLDFLAGVNYPVKLASAWSGNDPCSISWIGISCNPDNKVSVINLPNYKLNGTLSSSIGKLSSLVHIILNGNNLASAIPTNLTGLKSLKLLNLSSNNLEPPIPRFASNVLVDTDGNPLLNTNQTAIPPSPGSSNHRSGNLNPPSSDPPSPTNPSSPNFNPPSSNPSSPTNSSSPNLHPPSSNPSSPTNRNPSSNTQNQENPSRGSDVSKSSNRSSRLVTFVAPLAGIVALLIFLLPLAAFCIWKKKKGGYQVPSPYVVHPRDPSDPDNLVKIAVANSTNNSLSNLTASVSQSSVASAGDSHLVDAGNLVISVQVLRKVTRNFAPENELGRGGFGVVYKGELDDGTMIAVKRMEAAVISSKALDEFQAEIAVLSKVRHRHLVSLLGYSIEGNERLLVYEYLPQGALSKHLFHWEMLKLDPLSWKRRLNIALDVARGIEYLHSMAHQIFIHRDLKSSNILLGDDFRAKVSDFGLVKLAPDGKSSMATRLAGTFGYLAPEYAVTGKVTTKVDVFSYGVVLMELLTGLMALDENRPEETRYLASWFWQIKSSQEKLMAAIDPALDVTGEIIESISIVAELAGHCTVREPNQRPDMGHVVNVLGPLVDKWKPMDEDKEDYSGVPYDQPLLQMVKGWQATEGSDYSFPALDDSKGSIPARPTGFAESFTSADGR